MKYDVDLQEIDARLDARGRTCTRKKVLRVVEGNEKKNARSRERSKKKKEKERREKKGTGKAEIYASDYYATSENCLS